MLDTQNLHYSDRECDKIHRVAFVIVDPSLHCDYGLTSECPDNIVALMTYCCRNRESGDCRIRNRNWILNLVRQLPEPASKNNSDLRAQSSNMLFHVV